MTTKQRRLPLDEHARRGREIYQRVVLPSVGEGNNGKVVAIDIDTEAFEMADDRTTATDKLVTRFPNAQIWFERIGHPSVVRFGYSKRMELAHAQKTFHRQLGLHL